MPVQALDVESGSVEATALPLTVACDGEGAQAAPGPVDDPRVRCTRATAPASSTTTVSPVRRPRPSA